jgi:hypothetical protein
MVTTAQDRDMLDTHIADEIRAFAALVRDDLSKQTYPANYKVGTRWSIVLKEAMNRAQETDDATEIVRFGLNMFDVETPIVSEIFAAQLLSSRADYIARYPELHAISETQFLPSDRVVAIDGVTFSPKLQQTFSYYDEVVRGMGKRPTGIVVEVGSGFGKLMRVFHLLGTRCCVLVDLPESLLFGFAFLRASFPSAKMHTIRSSADVSADMADRYDFIFCPIQQFVNLQIEGVELLVNAYSFAEMTQACVDHIIAGAETLRPQFLWSFNMIFSDKTIHYDTGGLDGEANETVLPISPMWWPQRAVLYPTVYVGKYRITGSVTLARASVSESELIDQLARSATESPAVGDRLLRLYFAALWSEKAELADRFFAELRAYCAEQNFDASVGYDFRHIGEVRRLRKQLAHINRRRLPRAALRRLIRNPITRWIYSLLKSWLPFHVNQSATALAATLALQENTPVMRQNKMNPSLEANLPPDIADLSNVYAERNMAIFLLDAEMIARQNVNVAKAVNAFFKKTNSFQGIDENTIAKYVAEFRQHYLASPITMNIYGANFPSGVNLFLMARCFAGKLIVESGVYKGQSSHFLSCACPDTPIHSFDPNLNEVNYRTPGVTFHEHDWMSTDIKCEPVGSGFGFFDDHQNQAMRIVQAHQRGFRHLLFDDSWPLEAVIGCGHPPVPSIDMLIGPPLEPGRVVKWVESGKLWTYVHDAEMQELCGRARRLIKAAYDVPSLYRETGVPTTSAYKFVELH